MGHLPVYCSKPFEGSLVITRTIGIAIGIGIGIGMVLGHEKLDVYRLSIDRVAWVYETSAKLVGIHRSAKDPWLRASQIAAMLGRLGGRGYRVKEGVGENGFTEFDPDPDSDFDKI